MTDQPPAPSMPPPAPPAASVWVDLGDDPARFAVVVDQGRAAEPGRVVVRIAVPPPPSGGGVRLALSGSPEVVLDLLYQAVGAVVSAAETPWTAEDLAPPLVGAAG